MADFSWKPSSSSELLLRQPVEIGHRAEQGEIPEPPHELLADALDVHRGADPVDQRLEPARRAGTVGTAVHHLPLGLHDLVLAERAVRGHPELLRAAPVLAGRPDDLRNHVPGPLHDHEVALADLLAVDVLLVVQRRARDGDTADLDRLEQRPRVERTRPPDADQDLVQRRLRRHRSPLERARPARPVVQRAEASLLLERVDLDHDPVDLVVELDAPLLPGCAGLGDLLDRLEPLREGVGAEATLGEPGERLRSASRRESPRAAPSRRPRSRAAARR